MIRRTLFWIRRKHFSCTSRDFHWISRRSGRNGFALITTLWVMAILGVMAASISFEAQCESRIESWSLKKRRAYNLARAGVHMTAGLIRQHARDASHNLHDKWFSGPAKYKNARFGRGYYSIVRSDSVPKNPASRRASLFSDDDLSPEFGLRDEESKLNVNVIDFYQLCRLPGLTEPLAAGILHYRAQQQKALEEKNARRGQDGLPEIEDEDDLVTLPVRRLSELLEVEGMTEELLFGTPKAPGGLSRLLTCFSSGKTNINTAPPEILRALGLNQQQVKVVTEYRRGKSDGFTSVDETLNLIDTPAGSLKRILAVTSRNFRINCIAGFIPDAPEEYIAARLTLGKEDMRFTLWESRTTSAQDGAEDAPRYYAQN